MRLKFNYKYPNVACRIRNYLGLILLLGVMGGCEITQKLPRETTQKLPPEAFENADNLLTVDCLLPGQLIQLGMHQQYMSPPRPAILTAWECKVQGGQYAITGAKGGRETALAVWQQNADQGDEVAQNYMGEIYSKSWGQLKPDYAQAAKWFLKSSEQGFSRAQNNLGFLYERGLGVPKDKQRALNLYRQAMGAIDPVKLDQNIKDEINGLESRLAQALKTTETLQAQMSESEEIARRQQLEINRLKQIDGAAVDQRMQLEKVKNELQETRQRENHLREQLTAAQQNLNTAGTELIKAETQVALKDFPRMGKYYALIIGINNYQSPLVDLKTPVNDARLVDEILRQQYGFETILLVEGGSVKPTREVIYQQLIDLSKKINEDDNLLIYFAGHGDLRNNRAYWLPQGAQFENDANWVSTDDLTSKISYQYEGGGMNARHVLVIADSCYSAGMITTWLTPSSEQIVAALPSGLVTRSGHSSHSVSIDISPALSPQPDKTSAERRIGFIKAQHKLISRKELTSGGLEPVLDTASKNGFSIFANAFADALKANNGIISANEIYGKIGPQVNNKSREMGKEQIPVYAPIPNTGNNHGEFFFIAR